MDGLLSSVGLIICLALTGIAVMTGRWTTAYVTLALAGSLLGFLRYNFPPASIYLGDAGSMLIGLSIGVMAIQSSIKAQATVALAAPVGLLAIPIFDTTAAILRRKLTGRSIYTTDRGHLHHCLLAQGWGIRWTLLIITGSCALTAIGALVSLAFNNEWFGFLCALSVVSALIASRLFGHAELVLLFKRLASLGSSMTHFPSEERTGGYEVHLQGNMDWEQLWTSISSSSQGLNLRSLSLDINAPILHENYYARWNSLAEPTDETENCWSAEVPLIIQGQTCGRIQVVGWQDSKPVWEKVALLAALGQDLEKKASKLAHKSIRTSPAHGLPEPHLQGLDQAARVQLATQISEG
jgi:UDP-GlcNAc:undecaprenyl-phosphate GlcNAc-1-phosphate transferase